MLKTEGEVASPEKVRCDSVKNVLQWIPDDIPKRTAPPNAESNKEAVQRLKKTSVLIRRVIPI